MNASVAVPRPLVALAWVLPFAVLALMSLGEGFLYNFLFLAASAFVVLFFFSFLELRYPEFLATSAALAALPLLCLVYASLVHGQWWYGQIILLPGFIGGALLTLLITRRRSASSTSILLAVVLPYVGVALELGLFALLDGRR